MPADLDQFRCENSHGAVVGGKGLVQLRHMTANAWRLLNQIDLETGGSKIERGLNTADSSADNHYVSNIPVLETLAHLFSDLFFFHVISPHQVFYRLLKNAHLLRCPHPASLRRTAMYASLLGLSAALHLDIFEQPASIDFSLTC
jgi:hypothetical protein